MSTGVSNAGSALPEYFLIPRKLLSMKFYRSFLIGALAASASMNVLAQKLPNADHKLISSKFPDEVFFSAEEKVTYNFSMASKGKSTHFQITENFTSRQFTIDDEYTRIGSIIYDDYSDIASLKYAINGITQTVFPVIHTNYESEGIFHDDLRLCGYKIDMTKGKNYQVSYSKTYSNPRMFSRIYFHEGYPINKKTVTIEVPDWVELEIMQMNFDGFNCTRTEKEVLVNSKKVKKIIFEMEALNSSENESHSPSHARRLPHLLVFVKGYKLQKKTEKYFGSQDDIYQWCRALTDSVTTDTAQIAPIFREIVKNEKDSFRIMEKVFYWVQDHVRYIAFEDGIMGYKPMTADKVCNQLYGDCKGMANLTKQMLKLGGIDARLTWIGTTDIPYDNNLPTLAVYNHMICTAFLGGKRYYLDATEDYIGIDDYAERIQGRPIMIENGPTYINDKIPYLGYERNKLDNTIEIAINGNKLTGKSTITVDGEQKTTFLQGFSHLQTENQQLAIRQYLRANNKTLKIGAFTTSDLNERVKPLSISYDYEQSNSVYRPEGTKDLLILPEKDFEFEELEFDSTRKNDYEFNYRYYINTSSTLRIPDGFKIKDLPAPVAIKNDNYEIVMKYEAAAGQIKMTRSISMKNTLLKKEKFEQWNKDLSLLKKFYNSPLILTAQ